MSHTHHSKLLFANRTPEKAQKLAAKHHGEGFGLEALPDLLRQADIVVTCTSAPEPIMDAAMIDTAVDQWTDRKLTIVDLAIPRDRLELLNVVYREGEVQTCEHLEEEVRLRVKMNRLLADRLTRLLATK